MRNFIMLKVQCEQALLTLRETIALMFDAIFSTQVNLILGKVTSSFLF